MLTETGQAINEYVRDLFASGHKSSNKTYSGRAVEGFYSRSRMGGHRIDEYLDKAQRRQEGAMAALEYVKKRPQGMYEIAEAVLKMPIGETSGNCVEMAALALYDAFTNYHTNRSLCYWSSISKPGDHCFALISETPIMDMRVRQFGSVRAFTKGPLAREWLVIDPWLNTVCTADHYLEQGGKKLEQWAAQGKRIAWEHGSVGLGWYAPGGSKSEYKAAFEIAPIAFHAF